MDLFTKVISILAVVILMLSIFFTLSGCSLVEQIGKTLFKSSPEITTTPETPKKQLWQTIKGLTPNWLAIPIIALGAVAMFNGAAKLGMSCVIFGSVNLFMALATSRFGFWMAVMGLIGSAAAVIASILVKNKALKEIVFNMQDIKDVAADTIDQRKAVKEILTKQVKTTKKIVANIKTKMKLKGLI